MSRKQHVQALLAVWPNGIPPDAYATALGLIGVLVSPPPRTRMRGIYRVGPETVDLVRKYLSIEGKATIRRIAFLANLNPSSVRGAFQLIGAVKDGGIPRSGGGSCEGLWRLPR